MKWIIDLLIEKWNKQEKQKEFEPIPLHIEDDWAIDWEKQKKNDEKEDENVIIIDLQYYLKSVKGGHHENHKKIFTEIDKRRA